MNFHGEYRNYNDDTLIEYGESRPVKPDYTTFPVKIGFIIISHPLHVVQKLIQVGYEPFEPVNGITMFRRKCLKLPGALSLIKYIYQVDGLGGLFRGLVPRLLHDLIRFFVTSRTKMLLFWCGPLAPPPSEIIMKPEDEDEDVGAISVWNYVKRESCYLLSQIAGIVVSFPFQVIGLRMIAEFVGRETAHSRMGIIGAVRLIYHDHGIGGFFGGCVPLILGHVGFAALYGLIDLTVIKQIKLSEGRICLGLSFTMTVSSLMYPFAVVSSIMTLAGSRLKMGQPPCMPQYKSWTECWRYLSVNNALYRGANVFIRSYTGKCDVINGKEVPVGCYFGPNHLYIR